MALPLKGDLFVASLKSSLMKIKDYLLFLLYTLRKWSGGSTFSSLSPCLRSWRLGNSREHLQLEGRLGIPMATLPGGHSPQYTLPPRPSIHETPEYGILCNLEHRSSTIQPNFMFLVVEWFISLNMRSLQSHLEFKIFIIKSENIY